MIKILLAEDHLILRDGLKAILKEDKEFDVVAEAGNGKEVLEILKNTTIDVVIIDIDMPEIDGIETIRLIKKEYPEVKAMILSMLQHEKYVLKSFEVGALGYVLKTTGREELASAIKKVFKGEPFISHQISLALIKSLQKNTIQERESEVHIDLSSREREVLNLIAEGNTNTEIAEKIFTSKRTVESHRKSLMEKTGTRNSAALIKFAILNGILK